MKKLTPKQNRMAVDQIRDWLKAGATIRATDRNGPILVAEELNKDMVLGGVMVEMPKDNSTKYSDFETNHIVNTIGDVIKANPIAITDYIRCNDPTALKVLVAQAHKKLTDNGHIIEYSEVVSTIAKYADIKRKSYIEKASVTFKRVL